MARGVEVGGAGMGEAVEDDDDEEDEAD